MTESLAQLSKGALSDLAGVFGAMPEDALDGLIDAIVAAKRIVVFGLGREGLQMRGFAMRSPHGPRSRGLGRYDHASFRARAISDRLQGPGDLPDRANPAEVARKVGAASRSSPPRPAGGLAKHVDVVTVIPAPDDGER